MAPPWELRRRGLKDSLRHDQRVKEAIRKNLRDLIAEEAIITSDGHKRVKIPLQRIFRGPLAATAWTIDHRSAIVG